MAGVGQPARPARPGGTFLANHAFHLWATDLFTVPTLTFKTLYELVFIAHGRRELVHANVTANPTAAWVRRQVIQATPWGNKPRHLLRDCDAVYGRDFRQRAQRIGIDAIAMPVRSPRANAIGERVIGTLRRECIDHLIVLNEPQLKFRTLDMGLRIGPFKWWVGDQGMIACGCAATSFYGARAR